MRLLGIILEFFICRREVTLGFSRHRFVIGEPDTMRRPVGTDFDLVQSRESPLGVLVSAQTSSPDVSLQLGVAFDVFGQDGGKFVDGLDIAGSNSLA